MIKEVSKTGKAKESETTNIRKETKNKERQYNLKLV